MKNGGCDTNQHRDLLITGHENGSVQFWSAGSTVLSHIYAFNTNTIFAVDEDMNSESSESLKEEEWPPLRKVS